MSKKSLSLIVVVCFFLSSLSPYPQAHADTVLDLPAPGTMINLSPAYQPVIIKGLTVHKNNPFLFDFIIDVGQDKMSGQPLKNEGEKLIKYFLASLAIPDKDLWVNLSPYEKNKMVPEALGQTDMGRDLLEQDYILKQITASLIDPEKQLGKTFWNRVYAKARQMYGTTQVPVNTFNKVWIMADRAEVFEHNQTAFVLDSHLKVMLEEDYLALKKHSVVLPSSGIHTLSSQIVRSIILPELEKEVNTGKNFANLRQIFNSIILASWYKKNLKQALLNQVYANKAKIKGIDLNDPTIKQQIYQQYLEAYKKGVFNYIKEDVNASGESVPRKYFSGGITDLEIDPMVITDSAMGAAKMRGQSWNGEMDFQTGINADTAMNTMASVPVPAGFAEALKATGLRAKAIRISPVIEGKGDAESLLKDPLAQYILGSSSAAAIGSFPLRGQGKETPQGLDIKTAGDANALHFIEESTKLFIARHPQYAIVELASEGARDGSVSSPVGRIFHVSLGGQKHYIDTVEFTFDEKGKGRIKSFNKEKYISALERLRAQGVMILYKISDPLEKTEGLVNKDALHNPTDSWALNSFMVDSGHGPYRLPIDDNFRTAGISYHALKKAEDLGPLDLPSVAIPKIARANGIKLWVDGSLPEDQRQITPEYKSFLEKIVMVTLGPRGISLKDVDSHDDKHFAIIADGLRFMEKMQRYGVALSNGESQTEGMKISPVTDGDLIVRLMALAGPIELNDNKIYIEFGRSGSAEAEAARAFAKTVPGAHMVSRRVSTVATAKNVSYETANGYTQEENRINQILGYNEGDQTKVSYDEEERIGTVVGMTSVTGATNHLGDNFQKTMQRVKEDAGNKTITTTTLISDEQGNMYVAQVEYGSDLPALTDSMKKVLESDPHARAVFEEMPQLVSGDKAMITVDPKLKADFPRLFEEKVVNGRHLDPLQVTEALAQTGGSEIPVALNARRELLKSPLPAREKYAFPKFSDTFRDAQGNVKTFRQIVQGMMDNFWGIESPDAWRLNDEIPVPKDIFPLSRPGLQVTGPSEPLNMAINQLNALLSARMPDLEDASASWYVPAGAPKEQTVGAFAGIHNESELLGGEWENGRIFINKNTGKKYQLTQPLEQRPATIERLPSIHLLDKHILINGKPTPAIDIALALHFLNTHGALTQNGSGNYYYIPKIQTPKEALIVEEKLMKLEELTGLPLGTIKIEALYEEGNAGRWLPVIMWIWRHRLIGTNVGRWDYIGSLIEMWKDEGVFPDPQGINMNSSNLIAYQRYNALLNVMAGIKNGEETNAAPIGGMAAVMLYPKTDAYDRYNNNPKTLRSMKIDKLRERLLGLIFVPDEPLAEGQGQPTLEEALSGKVKGRLYDAYRQSWVATTDPEYVAAGNGPLRADIKELQALLDAPEEWTEIDGKKVAPMVSSGLTKGERDLFITLKLLNSDGKISPWVISKENFNKPEDLFNGQLWNELYSIPKGDITIEHIQHAFYMAAQYGFQILNGNYAAAIDDYEAGVRFMNDLATYRIFVGWLWTAFHHQAKLTKDGWIKDPELVPTKGVIPNKNVIEIKAGTALTPGIFDQVWDAHNAWTKAFFADQDKKGVTSNFDRRWADVIMEVLRRQLLSNRYLQHSPRVLFVIAEANPQLRQEILDAVFNLTREQAVERVKEGTLSQKALDARDYVFDYYPSTDAAMVEDNRKKLEPGSLVTVPLQTRRGLKNVEANVIHHDGDKLTVLMNSNAIRSFNSNKKMSNGFDAAMMAPKLVANGLFKGLPDAIESLKDRDIKGQTVLVRTNQNVPFDEEGKITDTTRLEEAVPLLKFLLEKGAHVILIGHQGRTKDRRSLEPTAGFFEKEFPDNFVEFYKNSINENGLNVSAGQLKNDLPKNGKGTLQILENVRFALDSEQGEKGSVKRRLFASELSSLADIFIIDAYGDIGSNGASIEDLPKEFALSGKEFFVGPSMIKEADKLASVVEDGVHAVVMGGVKPDKIAPVIDILNNTLSKNGFILLGSAPSSQLKSDNPLLLDKRTVSAVDYSTPDSTVDIGAQTIKLFDQKLDTLQPGENVIVNGTMGWVEAGHTMGTEDIFAKLGQLAKRGVNVIFIGGDGSANARKYGLDKLEHVVLITGGGVPLKILAGSELVGVSALREASSDAAMLGIGHRLAGLLKRKKDTPVVTSNNLIIFPNSPAIRKSFPESDVRMVLEGLGTVKGPFSRGNLPRVKYAQSIFRGLISEIPFKPHFILNAIILDGKPAWSFKGDSVAFHQWRLQRIQQLSRDSAMAPQANLYGGIDLNTSSGMQWKLSKDGSGVEMNIDPAMIERVKREGIESLSPVIFKITPVASIWPLVGLQGPVQAELVGV